MTAPPHFAPWSMPTPSGQPSVAHLGQLAPPDPAVGRVEMGVSNVDIDGYSIYRYSYVASKPKEIITDRSKRGLSDGQRKLISGGVAAIAALVGFFLAQFVGTSIVAFLFGAALFGAVGFGLGLHFTSPYRYPNQQGSNVYLGENGLSVVNLRDVLERGMANKSFEERLARFTFRYDGPERWAHSLVTFKGEGRRNETELLTFRDGQHKSLHALGSSTGGSADELMLIRRAMALMLAARVPAAKAALAEGRELEFPHYPDMLAELDGKRRRARLVIHGGVLTHEVEGRAEHSIPLADLSAKVVDGSFVFGSRSNATVFKVPYEDLGDGAVLAAIVGV